MGKPNIILILTDDQGCWAMGCAGNREIVTPNLDRLAAGGMRCENFFCASPVCSPARASLLTGRIPSQHGIHDWLAGGNIRVNGKDREIEYLKGLRAYTEDLADNGYVCGITGKWHLGASRFPQKGFTYWHVFPWGGGNYNNARFIRNGKLKVEPGYLSDVVTRSALDFIAERSKHRRPFYLSVHYTAPHSPWDRGQHPEELVGLYKKCKFKTCPDLPRAHPWQSSTAPRGTGPRRHELLSGYYAAITGVDRGVGLILDKLERLGLREDTLVIFTSDNGMNMGHHGIWGKGNGTFPLNMYDTSVKVPMLISQPGRVPAGAVCAELLSHYDVKPTLLDYVGIKDRERVDLPGHSFAALLRCASMPRREQVVVFDEYGPVRMLRTRKWKYIHRYPYGPHELYDLANDPGEERNLAGDPTQARRVAGMRADLGKWFLRYTDPDRDGIKEPVNGKGQIDLVGAAGKGRRAFSDAPLVYLDAAGNAICPVPFTPGTPPL